MTEVNLKLITETFKAVANERGWCSMAERIFARVTGVTVPQMLVEKVPCGCGSAFCQAERYIPETRFLLPEDAPETVPAGPIFDELIKYYSDTERGSCCEDCDSQVFAEMRALQRIADVLPGKPDLSRG